MASPSGRWILSETRSASSVRSRLAARAGLLALLALAARPCLGQTLISGNQTGTLTLAASPYVVTADLTVPAGGTLVIEPGVTLQFRYSTTDLFVQGRLLAQGTPGQPIRFTAEAPSPAPGQWSTVRFQNATPHDPSILQHCIVEYGGAGSDCMIRVEGDAPQILDCTIAQSSQNGVLLVGADPEIRRCLLTGNRAAAISIDATSFPVMGENQATDNARDASAIRGGSMTRSGTWAGGGLPFAPLSDVTVRPGAHLTLAPGTIVQLAASTTDLFVEGTLTALGTSELPILFTSDERPVAPGQWSALYITADATQPVSQLRSCIIEGGSGGRNAEVVIVNSAPVFDACIVRTSSQYGVWLAGSTASIADCDFTGNALYAISMDTASFPELRGNSASGNTAGDAIAVQSGTLARSGTWVRDDIPYALQGDVTVPPGATLTIEPGTTLQFRYTTTDLLVSGQLLAEGTGDAPILFVADDPVPAPGLWGAVVISADAAQPVSRLRSCVVEGGGTGRTAEILIAGSAPVLEACIVRTSSQHGIALTGSAAAITDCDFTGNVFYPVSMDTASFPTLRANSAAGNTAGDAIAVQGGTVSQTGTWLRDGIPYALQGDVTVGAAAVLTLEPGVTLQFRYTTTDLFVQGGLVARGTEALPILFTSDDAAKAPGQWGGVTFGATSDPALSALEYCRWEYGGAGRAEMLRFDTAAPDIAQCAIAYSSADGIGCVGAAPRIAYTRLLNNGRDGIRTSSGAQPVVEQCVISDNAGLGINNIDTARIIQAGNNYWGDPTGPRDTLDRDGLGLLNPAGLGDAVSEYVNWAPFLTAEPAGPGGGNLLRNPGAEEGSASANGYDVVSIPGWTTSANFTAVVYGAPDFPTAAESTRIEGGSNFFAGGPANALASARQRIDVSAQAAAIDAGTRAAELAADLAGYAAQGDNARVTAAFLGAGAEPLGELTIGPVAGTHNQFAHRSAEAPVPPGTRAIEVTLLATRQDGSYNDGYFDNIWLALIAAEPMVELAIERTPGGVRVSWPAAYQELILEQAPAPAAGATWTAVPGVTVVGDRAQAVIANPVVAAFFRLRRPS